MDFSPKSWRARKPPPPKNSDLYSTVVIHDKDDGASREAEADAGSTDIYATMVYKDDVVEDEEESLPPLLKHLPKDFGGGGDDDIEDSDDDGDASISGTMIIKTDRRKSSYSGRSVNAPSSYSKPRSGAAAPAWGRRSPRGGIESDEEEDEENAGDFSTFVVRRRDDDDDDDEQEDEEEGMGTMVRKGSGGGGGGTMRRAVESMQKVGDIGGMGYGKGRKSSGGEGIGGTGIPSSRQQGSGKISSSSIAECMAREDPSTKYELLHELGKHHALSFECLIVRFD